MNHFNIISMKTTKQNLKQDEQRKKLLRKFYALLRKMPSPTAAKEEILLSFNRASSKYLTLGELECVVMALESATSPKVQEQDRWRKRLIAAIGGWLRAMNRVENIEYIKSIACRASGKDNFNKIPLEQLRSLYNTFRNKAKDIQSVEQLTRAEIDLLTISN